MKLEVDITVSPDKLKAVANLPLDKKGQLVAPAQLNQFLKEKGIVFGINVRAIKRIYKQYQKDSTPRKVILARGEPPQKGQDGKVEYKVEAPTIGILREDGTIDYRIRNIYQTVVANQVIAIYHPAQEGTPGRDIYNQPVEAPPGDECPIQAGPQVHYNESDHCYRSSISGLLELKDGTASVNESVSLRQVSLATGDLNLNQDLVVHGDILAGSTVKVKGNLLVNGNVESSQVSVQGNITIKNGVAHPQGGLLEATGYIEVNHARNATLRAGKRIYIHTEAAHCDVDACESVVMTTKNGELIGGDVRALNKIQVNRLGSSGNPRTVVCVGLEHSKVVGEKIKDIFHYEANLKKINDLPQNNKQSNEIPPEALEELSETKEHLAKLVYFLRKEVDVVLAKMVVAPPEIDIIKESFGRVEIFMQGRSLKLRKQWPSAKYIVVEDKEKAKPKISRMALTSTQNSYVKFKDLKKLFQFQLATLESYCQKGFVDDEEQDELKEWTQNKQQMFEDLIASIKSS